MVSIEVLRRKYLRRIGGRFTIKVVREVDPWDDHGELREGVTIWFHVSVHDSYSIVHKKTFTIKKEALAYFSEMVELCKGFIERGEPFRIPSYNDEGRVVERLEV